MKLKAFACSIFAFGVAGVSYAQFAYAVDANADLYLVSLSNGGKSLIGSTGVVLMESLSLNGSGSLFGADSLGNFYSINTGTGSATLVGNTGLGNIEGMDWANGATFAFDFGVQPSLYTINEATGAPTLSVQSNTITGVLRSMAFNASGTSIYMVADLPNLQTLYNMAPSGVTTQIGALGNTFLVAAVDIDPNTGTMWALDVVGNVGTVNLGTGALTVTGNTGVHAWLGMTMAVPEPGSMFALGAGIAALAARRRKKAKA